jgi:hypothetical protein
MPTTSAVGSSSFCSIRRRQSSWIASRRLVTASKTAATSAQPASSTAIGIQFSVVSSRASIVPASSASAALSKKVPREAPVTASRRLFGTLRQSWWPM